MKQQASNGRKIQKHAVKHTKNIASAIKSDSVGGLKHTNINQTYNIMKSKSRSTAQLRTEQTGTTFNHHNTTSSVIQFTLSHCERLRQLGRVRSSDIFATTLNRFIRYRKGSDCTFENITPYMMQLFEADLKSCGLRRNTIGFYMRTFRTLYNIAVDLGFTTNNHPFRHVYTGKDKTAKRALKSKDIRAIINLDLSTRPSLDFARDMFLVSFFARGMSFVDMAYLKKKDKDGDHFTYFRRKTGQQITVEWIPEIQKILDKYKSNPTEYLFPIIIRTDKSERRQYLNKIESVNHSLKTVAKLANISGNLTMYYARHTWCTLARNKNIPISVISEALGHDNERTTRIYIDSISTGVVDKANRHIIKEILNA